MNWGTKITIAMVLFMTFIVTLVVRISMAKPELVADNYYEQEINFETKIKAQKNMAKLAHAPEIYTANGNIFVDISPCINQEQVEGQIHIYRPNNASLDITIPITGNPTSPIVVPEESLVKGVYSVQVSWDMNGKKYFSEERIYLN